MERKLFNYPCVLIERDDKLFYTFNGAYEQQLTKKELERLLFLINNTLDFYKKQSFNDSDIEKINYFIDKEHIEKQLKPSYKTTKKNKTGYVYLFQNMRYRTMKIGFSKNPEKRVVQINNASPDRIIILDYFKGTYKDEKEAHRFFNDRRLKNEWFIYTPKIKKYFKRKRNEI